MTEMNSPEGLKGTKDLYASFLSSIGDRIAIKDLDFRVIYENEAHVKALGSHVGELCYKAYHGRDEVCDNCPVAMTFRDGSVHTIERAWGDGAGRRWYEITASPVRDREGRTIAGIEVIRDVTERKRMEELLRDGNRLLSSLSTVYSTFFETTDYRSTFNALLTSLLELTGSEYGFIGEVLRSADGAPYLKTHALTNIAWDEETRALYDRHAAAGFEFHNLDTLFGVTLRTGMPFISNDPAADPKASGLPEGHPPLRSFLGMPFRRGDTMIGMVGIANRPGGYDEAVVAYLDTYLKACTHIIDSYGNDLRRRKAEKDLQVSEKHYRELFENSPNSLWEEDFSEVKRHADEVRARGVEDCAAYLDEHPQEVIHCASLVRVVNVNNATLKLYKAKRREELLEGLHKVFTPASREAVVRGLVALAKGEMSFEAETANRTMEGDELILHMKWSIMPGYEDTWSKVLVSMTDLTALRRAEEYVKRILETVDEGFIVIDLDFNIVTANRAYSDKLKISGRGLHGRKCYELSHRKSRPCFEEGEDCPVVKTFRTGSPNVAMHVHEDAEGNRHYAELKSYPLKDSAGNVISAIETVVDVSEKMKLQEELTKSQKLESIGLLAGGIAHDFNNLLTGIFGHISLAKLTADAATRSRLEEAEGAMGQAKALTQQLLTFSRGGEPVMRTLHLSPLLLNAVKFALSGSNIRCDAAIADDIRPVAIDEGQIIQVIHNIVINAVEAMPDGGAITVSAGNARVGEDSAALLKAGDYVRIAIRDTGIGIPREYLSKIFDPYFTTKRRGSGLGLAATYSIIRKHGGRIEAESRPGQGSTFIIFLPASSGEVVPKEPAATGLVPGQGRVLVMDDEDTIRLVCGSMLRTAGYEAEFAEEGSETIRKYAEARQSGRPFDVVILDLTVRGGLGGAETMQRLLEMDPAVRGVVSSGYAEDPVMANFAQHGFRAALCKPYQIEEMSRVLKDLLRED